MDLKRFVLGMVTNQIGLPLFVKAYSGNKSDKKSLMEMIKKTQCAIDLDDESYWIADSALYTEENIKLLGTETKWITHMPATVAEAQRLLNSNLNMVPGSDPRYAFFAADINYGDVPQRAVVVWSEEMKKRNEKTFERKIEKRRLGPKKILKS